MSGLKEIRTRINSVTSTRKITSAMKMVSAAKFHKASEGLMRFEPYYQKSLNVLSQVLPSTPETGMEKWFKQPQKNASVAFIVLTSNASMCGGFNNNIIKKIVEETPHLLPDYPEKTKLTLFCLGKKGGDFFKKGNYYVHPESNNHIVHKPTYTLTSPFSTFIIKEFLDGSFDSVFVIYNKFKNPAVQVPTIQQFLPIVLPEEEIKISTDPNLIFEPNQQHIMEVIIPKLVKVFFHKLVLENAVGEHGARMTAMHQATDNATELISNLKLQYNKARQASITKEILEIVSGAEALKG